MIHKRKPLGEYIQKEDLENYARQDRKETVSDETMMIYLFRTCPAICGFPVFDTIDTGKSLGHANSKLVILGRNVACKINRKGI